MADRNIKQGQVYIVSIEPDEVVGSEQCGSRPFLILSINSLNKNGDNVIMAPLTSSEKKWMPQHYKLIKDEYDWLIYDTSTVMLEKIRDISKKRLERKLGEINEVDLLSIIKLIQYNFREFDLTVDTTLLS